MSKADEHISKETLDQVSTESFSQNIANYRSLLLKWERAVDGGDLEDKKAQLMLREAGMLWEIIASQINSAGSNARLLGVPPEELFAIKDIYVRVFKKLAIKVTQQIDLYSPQSEAAINAAESIPEDVRPEVFKRFLVNIKVARASQGVLLNHPESASLVLPSYLKALNELVAATREIAPNSRNTQQSSAPPQQPPLPPSSGGGDSDSGLPRRIDRLEERVDKMAGELLEIKVSLGRIEERLNGLASKSELSSASDSLGAKMESLGARMAKVEERLTHMPTNASMYLAGGTALAAVLGVMAKGFGWLG